MAGMLRYYVISFCFTTVFIKDSKPQLPPCPTNLQFLPGTLPMHCKISSQPQPPPFPPIFPPPLPPPPPPPPQNSSIPPVPPPGFPPPMPMGNGLAMPMGPIPMGMPGMPMGMPGMPMGMPMIGGPQQSKLPVIVMPFYSPDPAYKDAGTPRKRPEPYKRKIRVVKKNHHRYDSDSDTDTDTSSSSSSSDTDSSEYWNWKNRRSMRRRKKIRHPKNKEHLNLTPILQYVRDDGYVMFEKKISKGEAKGWLNTQDGRNQEKVNTAESHEENQNYRRDGNGEETKTIIKWSNKNSDGEGHEKGSPKISKISQKRQRRPSPQTVSSTINKRQY